MTTTSLKKFKAINQQLISTKKNDWLVLEA